VLWIVLCQYFHQHYEWCMLKNTDQYFQRMYDTKNLVLLVAAWCRNFYWGVFFCAWVLLALMKPQANTRWKCKIRYRIGFIQYTKGEKQKKKTLLVFWGFSTGVAEVSILLGCDTASLGSWLLTVSQSVRNQLASDIVAHPIRKETSTLLLLFRNKCFSFINTYIYTHTHTHTYIHTYIHTHTYWIGICIFVCVCICTFIANQDH
jgi:hypothetical protein